MPPAKSLLFFSLVSVASSIPLRTTRDVDTNALHKYDVVRNISRELVKMLHQNILGYPHEAALFGCREVDSAETHRINFGLRWARNRHLLSEFEPLMSNNQALWLDNVISTFKGYYRLLRGKNELTTNLYNLDTYVLQVTHRRMLRGTKWWSRRWQIRLLVIEIAKQLDGLLSKLDKNHKVTPMSFLLLGNNTTKRPRTVQSAYFVDRAICSTTLSLYNRLNAFLKDD